MFPSLFHAQVYASTQFKQLKNIVNQKNKQLHTLRDQVKDMGEDPRA